MSTNLRLRGCAALVAAIAVLAGASCSETVRTGRAPAYLIIQDFVAEAGGFDEEANHLESDVVTHGGVFEDVGLVTFRLALKEPTGVGPTDNNIITINRYRVNFRRADGRNTPGVDVPWPFEGAGTVTVTDEAELGFVLVRAQAKLEPPLRQLAAGDGAGIGGAGLISTIADVTFFGRDQVGNEVSVTGSISVNFADWADPDNE